MNNLNDKEINKIWNENGKNLKKPKIFYSVDSQNTLYFVYRDDTTIIFLIPSDCNSTFVIPKKYCTEEKNKTSKFYKINDTSKLSVVSCVGTKNEYEKFILDNLVEKTKC